MGLSLSKLCCPVEEVRTNGNETPEVSPETRERVSEFMEMDYIRTFRTSVPELRQLLTLIPVDEDILRVHYESGFNLLQKCIGEHNVEAVKLILSRNPDLNSGPCSLPLHIACQKGYLDCVEDLIEHGARLDVEARMCWPGPHSQDCPGIMDEDSRFRKESITSERRLLKSAEENKCQSAMYYAVEGQQRGVLEHLLWIYDNDPQGTFELGPLLNTATKRGAWFCCDLLLESKAEAVNPSIFRDFINEETEDKPEMTLFHVLFYLCKKPASFTLNMCKIFLFSSLRSQVNTADYLGNTPLQSIIIRYAFEESTRLRIHTYEPWGKTETKEMINLILENIPVETLNQPGNSILSFIIRHIKDWGFIYDLLTLFIGVGASPRVTGRNGHWPLMACLMKLTNDDLLEDFDAESKFFFMHCLRLLCTSGADPNCVIQSSLTPIHILLFTVSEIFSSSTDEKMCKNFDFLRDILVLLFHYGLDANALTNGNSPSIFHGILKLVKKSRYAIDLEKVYELIVTLVQYGLNTNMRVRFPDSEAPLYGEHNPFPVAEYSHLLGYMFLALAEKEEILNECPDSFTEILYLLYYSMDHDELYKCLNFVYDKFPMLLPDSPWQILSDTVTDMLFKPRSLKQLARLVINRSLGGKPGAYAHQLPLAKILQNYLINYNA